MCRTTFRRGILGSVLVALCAVVLATSAAQEPSNTVYACVANQTGMVRIVGAGEACRTQEHGVQWQTAGPAGPKGDPGPQGPAGSVASPYSATVNCGERTVQSAIAEAGPGVAPVDITVSGFCDEDVVIRRSDTTLVAAAPGAGVRSIWLDGARGVQLLGLTVRGAGLVATNGAHFRAVDLTVVDASQAVYLEHGAVGRLEQPNLSCTQGCIDLNVGTSMDVVGGILEGHKLQPTDTPSGIRMQPGATLQMSAGTVIHGTWMGLHLNIGASATLEDVTITEAGGIGTSGSLRLLNCRVVDNSATGVVVAPGGIVQIGGGVFSGNAQDGIGAGGGVITIGGGAVVSGNSGRGLVAGGNASIFLNSATIENNASHGIALEDMAYLGVVSTADVRNNGGWGLHCTAPPAVTLYRDYGLQASGNAAGNINCTRVF